MSYSERLVGLNSYTKRMRGIRRKAEEALRQGITANPYKREDDRRFWESGQRWERERMEAERMSAKEAE